MTTVSRGLRARRVLLTMGAVATVGAGAGVVRVAADVAAGQPTDVVPVSVTSLQGQIDQEAARASAVDDQASALSDQLRTIQDAVTSASGAADAQTARAAQVAKDIAAAKARLTKLQAQLTAASGRLAALDAAGARIAATKQGKGTVTATTGASGAAGGGHDD
jgi:septal ring factor EnvC (AmiA/AmiB activator)